jgi:hypothetical protein
MEARAWLVTSYFSDRQGQADKAEDKADPQNLRLSPLRLESLKTLFAFVE